MEAYTQTPVPEAAASSEDNARASFLDLLIIIAQRRSVVLNVTGAAVVVSLILAFVLPVRFTATTRIFPPQQNQSLSNALLGQLSALGSMVAMAGKDLNVKDPADVLIGVLKSRTMEEAIVQKFNLREVYGIKYMSDARRELESNVDVKLDKQGFLNIAVTDKDPKRATDMANAYVSELKVLTENVAITEAGQRRLFFEQQLKKAKDNLADAEVALKQSQQKTGVIQIDAQARALIESLLTVQAQIAAKEVQLQGMRSFATEQNPNYIVLEQELAALRKQQQEIQSKRAGKGDIQIGAESVPEVGLEYIRRLRDVKYNEAMFEMLAKQFEVAKLDEAKQSDSIQVLDPAVIPDRKSSPKRALILVLGTFLGLFGAVLYVLAQDALQRNPRASSRIQMLRHSLGSRRTRRL